jgi:hypothetical protein
MARRVFFSFHYERDVWRASVVRNSWVTKPDRESAGFFDAGIWEEAKKKGDAAIKKLIDDALVGTTVTAVLIGAETSTRTYVKYEVDRSLARGNGLLGIRIHNVKDKDGKVDIWGPSPLPSGYPVYDWFNDHGYANLGKWIEAAAVKAGK